MAAIYQDRRAPRPAIQRAPRETAHSGSSEPGPRATSTGRITLSDRWKSGRTLAEPPLYAALLFSPGPTCAAPNQALCSLAEVHRAAAGQAWCRASRMGPAGLLGAAIEDGTAIGEDRRGWELPSMPGSAASGRSTFPGMEGADGRAEPGRGGEAEAWPCSSVRICNGLQSSFSGVDQRPAHVDDVNHSDEACVASDRQVTEMPGRHDLGRVVDAC